MLFELLADLILAGIYLVACCASLAVRAKLSGSLAVKRFSAMGVGWLIGMVLLGAKVALIKVPLAREYLKPPLAFLIVQVLGLLAVQLPAVVAAIALISLAMLYARYS